MAERALAMADDGLAAEQIAEKLQAMALATHTLFVPGTLEYLHKGGRIGGAAALPPVGGAGSSLVETGWQLTEVEMEKLGSDVLITGLVPELDKQELPKEAE